MRATLAILLATVFALLQFASAHDDLSRFFTRWERDMSHPTPGLMAAVHLADSVMRLQQELLRKHEDRLNPQILDWLSSKALAQTLEAAFFRFADSPFAKLLSDGHYLLGVWQRQRHP